MSFPRKLELRDNFRKERKTRMAPSIESLRSFRSRVHELIFFFSLFSFFFTKTFYRYRYRIDSLLFSSLFFFRLTRKFFTRNFIRTFLCEKYAPLSEGIVSSSQNLRARSTYALRFYIVLFLFSADRERWFWRWVIKERRFVVKLQL